MIHEHITDPGASTMGSSGPPVENISAEGLPEPGVRPTRTLQRDPLGRFSVKPTSNNGFGGMGGWKAREDKLVGPMGPAGGIGPGGIDVTTGQFIPGVRNHAQLQDLERLHEISANASPYATFNSHSAWSDQIGAAAMRAALLTEHDRIRKHNQNIADAKARP